MQKDFDGWNIKKKVIENIEEEKLFRTGEIWWCSVGINVRNESCGKGIDYQRPVLILRKLSAESFIGIPISSQEKIGSWFIDITMNGEKRCVLLYQIRMFSSNRFQHRLAVLNDCDFKRVKEKLKYLLELL